MSGDLNFGHVIIRPALFEVRVDGNVVPIRGRAFDVLLALAQRHERVVTKDELFDLAWPGQVVEPNNLTVQISALRKALGAQVIATVNSRGYRWTLEPVVAPQRAADEDRRVVRRLATLVHGQIDGGFERLRGSMDAVLAAWQAARTVLIEGGAPVHGGRVIELSPEAVRVEFSSPVDALRWGLELQRELACAGKPWSDAGLSLRLAITIEDLIFDEGQPLGEAAQASKRLFDGAPIQAPLVVSDSVRAVVGERLPVRFVALDKSLGGWRIESEGGFAGASGRVSRALAGVELSPRHAALAVLPFESGETASYFGDGITEEIISCLAANRALLVIARSSTLRYRGSTLSPEHIAGELGVRYLITGTVQRDERRLRIVAELVDAPLSRVIWSQRYDGRDDDLFAFQAEIAGSIAGAIDPRVTAAEIERVPSQPTAHLGAYDCVLRGLALQTRFRDEDFAAAGDAFRRATELDPRYARAHAHLAWWHNLRVGEGRSSDIGADAAHSEALSTLAMSMDPQDALVISIAAHVQGYVRRRLPVAMEMFEQALQINPSCAFAWLRSATAAAFLGRGEEAQERARNAMRLSPFDPQAFTCLTTSGTASFVLGRYDEAVAWYAKARRANPGYRAAWRLQVAALALAGDLQESQAQARGYMQFDPSFRVGEFSRWYAMTEPHLSRLLDGMRRAGLQE